MFEIFVKGGLRVLKRMVKDSFLLRAVMILLALLLVTMYIASGYLAKYISSAGDGDGARVASFAFNVNNNDTITLDLSSITGPGTSQTYNFTVTSPNTNEVARDYEVVVNTTNNLPLTLTLSEGVTTLDATSETVATGIAYELSTNGSVGVGTALTKSYSLTVAWPSNQSSLDYSKVVGAISISVIGEQVD